MWSLVSFDFGVRMLGFLWLGCFFYSLGLGGGFLDLVFFLDVKISIGVVGDYIVISFFFSFFVF